MQQSPELKGKFKKKSREKKVGKLWWLSPGGYTHAWSNIKKWLTAIKYGFSSFLL